MGHRLIDTLDDSACRCNDDRIVHARENTIHIVSRDRCLAQTIAHLVKNCGKVAEVVVVYFRQALAEVGVTQLFGLFLELLNSPARVSRYQQDYCRAQDQKQERNARDEDDAVASASCFLLCNACLEQCGFDAQLLKVKCTLERTNPILTAAYLVAE